MSSAQMDLFGISAAPPAQVLREEERFGRADAKCGLPLRNHYSSRIFDARLVAYERGFHEELKGERNAERS